jgi:FAD/FMN-containing dehydrogenase
MVRTAQEARLLAPLVSHAGDGNFHLMLILDPSDAAEMERARGVVSDMVGLAHSMGGTCTGANKRVSSQFTHALRPSLFCTGGSDAG